MQHLVGAWGNAMAAAFGLQRPYPGAESDRPAILACNATLGAHTCFPVQSTHHHQTRERQTREATHV